eukprot:2056330-Lingulodinium_polyedra.AAC.1
MWSAVCQLFGKLSYRACHLAIVDSDKAQAVNSRGWCVVCTLWFSTNVVAASRSRLISWKSWG